MFKNVLVGVDGRPNGRDAVALAQRLTDPAGQITLAHVHNDGLHPVRDSARGLLIGEQGDSREMLERERAACRVEAELIRVLSVSAGRGLHRQAEEQMADLLVVGSCSHGVFGRAMLGDDTRAALNGARCPVAIASLGYAQHHDPIAKVGVGYDGSQESKAALAVAQTLVASNGLVVQALQVLAIPTYAYTAPVPPPIGESIDLMVKEAPDRLKELPEVEGHAVYGVTGEELAAFSDGLDLLIVGSRSYGPVRRLVLGSTSDYLQRHARSSLLVLPRSAADHTDGAPPSSERSIQSPATVHV